jgi:AcrR family transcriptional regulator
MAHSVKSPRRAARGRPASLPDALVAAAAALIAERGPQGFSLREVARRARVSEAAPYWHFRDREALLAAVARQGFEALSAAMTRAAAQTRHASQRLEGLAVAYVRFALRHPSHLRVMFGPEVPEKAAHPDLHAAAEASFGLLVGAIAQAQRAGRVRAGDPVELAIAAAGRAGPEEAPMTWTMLAVIGRIAR